MCQRFVRGNGPDNAAMGRTRLVSTERDGYFARVSHPDIRLTTASVWKRGKAMPHGLSVAISADVVKSGRVCTGSTVRTVPTSMRPEQYRYGRLGGRRMGMHVAIQKLEVTNQTQIFGDGFFLGRIAMTE